MKLPFTWSLSSVWQTATNTIRTTLNLAKKKKSFCAFCSNVKNQGPIKVLLRRFPTKNSPTFNRHCKEYEISFHMNIVKLMAKQHKHHQNDFELDWKIEKNNVFLLKRQKLGSNQSTFVTFSDKKLTNFQSSLQRVWNYLSHEYCQVDGKTTQTPSERFWTWPKNEKKIMFFLIKRQKLGSNQSNITTFFPTKLPLL